MKHLSTAGVSPDLFLLAVCVLEGLFPIIVKTSTDIFPPFYFVALCSAIAALLYFLVIVARGGFVRPIPLKAIRDCGLVSLFIFSGFILIFTGAKHTTAINTALLLQFEMVTTYVVYEFYFKQHHTRGQLIGAVIVLLGSLLVLYNGSFTFNKGDLIVLSSTLCFPFGNYFAKRALNVLPPTHVLFFRFSIIVPVFLAISYFFEDLSGIKAVTMEHLPLVLTYAATILFLSKLLWYNGLRRMSVSRGIFILMAYPAFSLLFATFLINEIPTLYQIFGFVVAMVGIFIITKTKDSTPEQDTV